MYGVISGNWEHGTLSLHGVEDIPYSIYVHICHMSVYQLRVHMGMVDLHVGCDKLSRHSEVCS